MAANPIILTQTGTGRSRVHVPDVYLDPFNIGIGCEVTGTVTYNVEHTFDDPFLPNFTAASATWFANSGLAGKSDNQNGNYAYPVNGISVNVLSGTGTVTVYLLQAGTR